MRRSLLSHCHQPDLPLRRLRPLRRLPLRRLPLRRLPHLRRLPPLRRLLPLRIMDVFFDVFLKKF